jgi:hypothetical protein
MKLEVGQSVIRRGGAVADGQRGHVVLMDDGKLGVQLDRNAEKLVFPLNKRAADEWVVDERARLGPMQVARIAYGADRELRMARGEYGAKEWMSLSERERMAWMQAGAPESDSDRRRLYAAVMGAMAPA